MEDQRPGSRSEKLLKKFHITDVKTIDTPMGTNSMWILIDLIPRLSNGIYFEGCLKNPKTFEEDRDLVYTHGKGAEGKGRLGQIKATHSNYREGLSPFSKHEEGPGPTSKKKKVEKMMFKREEVDILRTQSTLNRRVSDL
ncbi:hypothetical protein KY289_029680 [Solanum tuberosum]|nr:hypothetical protein KY289_029680 [Solanum tuberosum]